MLGKGSNVTRTLNANIAVVKVVGEVLFLYGFLGWVYGVLIQLIHPYWLPLPISHLTPWIRVDTFTVISFILSAIGFLMWRLTRELTKLPTQ